MASDQVSELESKSAVEEKSPLPSSTTSLPSSTTQNTNPNQSSNNGATATKNHADTKVWYFKSVHEESRSSCVDHP